MIDVQNSTDKSSGGTTRLVVQANQSMSWNANMLLTAALGLVCMSIAFVMAAMGVWLVIPFAGAEVIFIGFCLHWTLHRLSRKEVITVDEDAIRLEWGFKHPDVSIDLPRRWSKLSYHCPDNPFEVGQLSLGAHGKHYQLGSCLGREEKRTLYYELQSVLRNS